MSASIFPAVRRVLFDHPLLLREVRTRMRGKRTFVIVFVYDLILILFMSLIYAGQTSRSYYHDNDFELGRSLFGWVSFAQLLLMLLVAPGITSASISAERERRSLDLMAITLLSPREIIWGKLISSISFSLILLISSVPLMGICAMFGGVSPIDVIRVLILTVASVFFYSSMAIFFSAIAKRTVVGVVSTSIGVLALTLGIPLLLVLVGEILREVWSSWEWLSMHPEFYEVLDWRFPATLISSPFAMLMLLFPNEWGGDVSAYPYMWSIHSALHALFAGVLLLLAARAVAYPRTKE